MPCRQSLARCPNPSATQSEIWRLELGAERRASLRPESVSRPNDLAARTRGAFHLLRDAADGQARRVVLAIPAHGLRVIGDAALGACGMNEPHPAVVTLEPLARHGVDLLLAVRAPGAELERNGLPAALVSLLRPGDEIRLGSGARLCVDFLRQPLFVLASVKQAGAHCQLCRGPIGAGRRIYACGCGALTHAETAAENGKKDDAELLDCALGTCSGCGRALVTEAGYIHGGADART